MLILSGVYKGLLFRFCNCFKTLFRDLDFFTPFSLLVNKPPSSLKSTSNLFCPNYAWSKCCFREWTSEMANSTYDNYVFSRWIIEREDSATQVYPPPAQFIVTVLRSPLNLCLKYRWHCTICKKKRRPSESGFPFSLFKDSKDKKMLTAFWPSVSNLIW